MEATMPLAKPVLKLFKISQNSNTDYDTYDSAIVAAYDEEEARNTHPDGDWECNYTWSEPDEVSVKYIGIATEDIEAGVVLASFNAG